MPEGDPPGARRRASLGRRWRSRRIVVRDDSMRPGFLPGDRLYADPRPGRPLAVGDVVALRDPEQPDRLLLKRIVRFAPTPDAGPGASRERHLVVEGDNAPRSRDSRQFGAVPPAAVVGLVWYRYAPAARAGPVPNEVF